MKRVSNRPVLRCGVAPSSCSRRSWRWSGSRWARRSFIRWRSSWLPPRAQGQDRRARGRLRSTLPATASTTMRRTARLCLPVAAPPRPRVALRRGPASRARSTRHSRRPAREPRRRASSRPRASAPVIDRPRSRPPRDPPRVAAARRSHPDREHHGFVSSRLVRSVLTPFVIGRVRGAPLQEALAAASKRRERPTGVVVAGPRPSSLPTEIPDDDRKHHRARRSPTRSTRPMPRTS